MNRIKKIFSICLLIWMVCLFNTQANAQSITELTVDGQYVTVKWTPPFVEPSYYQVHFLLDNMEGYIAAPYQGRSVSLARVRITQSYTHLSAYVASYTSLGNKYSQSVVFDYKPPVEELIEFPGTPDGRHRYMNGLFPYTWCPPDNWNDGSPESNELLDSLAEYDFYWAGDLNTSVGPFWNELKTRNPNQIQLHHADFNRIHDASNNTGILRRPSDSDRFGQMMYDAFCTDNNHDGILDHVAYLYPSPSTGGGKYSASPNPLYYSHNGDLAGAGWLNYVEYIVNWYDPEVPEIYAELCHQKLHMDINTWIPDGFGFDWWQYPEMGWHIVAGNGYCVDGDRDGIVGFDDVDEKEQVYRNWLRFCDLLRQKLTDCPNPNHANGTNFFLAANGENHRDATAIVDGKHVLFGLNVSLREHFPWGWGSTTTDYCQYALEHDGYSLYGFDSMLDYNSGLHQFKDVGNTRTPHGGYFLHSNHLQVNHPYLSILCMFQDGAVAEGGSFQDNAHICYSSCSCFTWYPDTMKDLKLLGSAISPAERVGDTWQRVFDNGVVKLRFNDNAAMVEGANGGVINSGGPFKYIAILGPESAQPDTLYRGGGWERQASGSCDIITIYSESKLDSYCPIGCIVETNIKASSLQRYLGVEKSWDGVVWQSATYIDGSLRKIINQTGTMTLYVVSDNTKCSSTTHPSVRLRYNVFENATGGDPIYPTWCESPTVINFR